MPKKPKTLSEKLFAALEGEKVQDLIDEDDPQSAKTVGDEGDSDEEIDVPTYGGVSTLRKANIPVLEELDPRYAGKKVSRKDLDEVEHEKAELGHMFEVGDSEDEDEDIEAEDDDIEAEDDDIEDEDIEDEVEDDDNEDEIEEENEDSEEESDFDDGEAHFAGLNGTESDMDTQDPSDNQQLLFETDDSEVEKGTHIRNQLIMYDKLLEMRIQLQKVLSTSMRLPKAGDSWKELTGSEEGKESLGACRRNLECFLDSALRAKRDLIQNSEDLRKRKLDEFFDGSAAKKTKLNEYEQVLTSSAVEFGAWRNEVLELWNEKTRLVSSSGKGSNFSSFEVSTLKQIDNILCDKDRLINRTRVRRVEYDILGEEEWNEKEDPEIFDDGDFYHQLLRELISAKTSGVEDPNELGRQWLEVQKIRSKMKKKLAVDTKASKGRKTRYDIHAKLVNFMAPTYVETMNDEAKSELYSSLFGQNPKGTTIEP